MAEVNERLFIPIKKMMTNELDCIEGHQDMLEAQNKIIAEQDKVIYEQDKVISEFRRPKEWCLSLILQCLGFSFVERVLLFLLIFCLIYQLFLVLLKSQTHVPSDKSVTPQD